MAERDIIVVGASAGGVEALTRLVRGLAPGLPASLFVVCHLPTGARSFLPEILSREGPLLAVPAVDGEPFHPGQIYVAPPDRHLLLGPDRRIRLSIGARENRLRPAIDPLFRSAARCYGPRTIGVILSGMLSDGVAGLMAVRGAGGLGIVQDPRDAIMVDMPQNAAKIAGADHVATVADMAPLLQTLVQQRVTSNRSGTVADSLEQMQSVVDQDMESQSRDERQGKVTVFSCPECGGSLWQSQDPTLIQFHCHVGHIYNGDVLLSEQSEALEAALWTAVRTFREKAVLALQMAYHSRGEGNIQAADRFEEQARQAERYGHLILRYVLNGDSSENGIAGEGQSNPGPVIRGGVHERRSEP